MNGSPDSPHGRAEVVPGVLPRRQVADDFGPVDAAPAEVEVWKLIRLVPPKFVGDERVEPRQPKNLRQTRSKAECIREIREALTRREVVTFLRA